MQAAVRAAAEVEAAMSAARAGSVTETGSQQEGSPETHHFAGPVNGPEPPLTRNMLRTGTVPGAFQHPSLVQAQTQADMSSKKGEAPPLFLLLGTARYTSTSHGIS